jgi:hypothetical protein
VVHVSPVFKGFLKAQAFEGGRVGKKTPSKNQVISLFAIKTNFPYNIIRGA